MQKLQIKQRPLITRPENFQGVLPFIAEILARRGVQSEQELDLKLKYLLAPEMKGLEQAIQIIDQALDQEKKIVIVGDYDADGATSTALMIWRTPSVPTRVTARCRLSTGRSWTL